MGWYSSAQALYGKRGREIGVRPWAWARKRGAAEGMQMTDEKLLKKNYVVGNVKFNKMIRNITEI